MSIVRPTLTFVALFALGSGCGSTTRDATRRRDSAPDSVAARNALAGATSTERTVLITATDYSFAGVPARIRAGWITLRLANAGSEVHMLGIGRVPYGHSAHAVLDAVANNRAVPETSDWGGPNAVSPGDTSTVALFFPAGEYAVVCFVESANGEVHARRGMLTMMTVIGTPDTANAPGRSDATVTLTSYHVGVSGAIAAGDRTVWVRNDASEGHDLEILELLPGHSAEDALRWFEHPAKGPPAARAIGGVVEIHPGQQALVSATFHRGRYLFLCWVPDDAGHPHFRRGMQKLVTVAAAR